MESYPSVDALSNPKYACRYRGVDGAGLAVPEGVADPDGV